MCLRELLRTAICSSTLDLLYHVQYHEASTKLMKDKWCAYRSPFRASQLYALIMVEDEVGS